MSWDLFVQDWGVANKLSDIPDNFEPLSLGKRKDIIQKIKNIEPMIDFSNPSWGVLVKEQFSIEFNMGNQEEIYSFVMHIRGGKKAIPFIKKILYKLQLKAADGRDDYFVY